MLAHTCLISACDENGCPQFSGRMRVYRSHRANSVAFLLPVLYKICLHLFKSVDLLSLEEGLFLFCKRLLCTPPHTHTHTGFTTK